MAITLEDVVDYLQTAPVRDPQLDRAFIMNYLRVAAPWLLEELRAEGRAVRRAEGRAEGVAILVHQCERRLARRLSEDERAMLRDRMKTLGPNRLADVVFDLSPQDLAAWLADPNAT